MFQKGSCQYGERCNFKHIAKVNAAQGPEDDGGGGGTDDDEDDE